jgi:hypothetical protein
MDMNGYFRYSADVRDLITKFKSSLPPDLQLSTTESYQSEPFCCVRNDSRSAFAVFGTPIEATPEPATGGLTRGSGRRWQPST